MTKRERELLEVARLIIMRNKRCALTGSLLLVHLGLQKKREAHDIDIVCRQPIEVDPECKGKNKFWVPDGFEQAEPTYPDDTSIKFINSILDVEIDFLFSPEEPFTNYKHLPCGSVIEMVKAKERFAKQESDAAEKHKDDLGL